MAAVNGLELLGWHKVNDSRHRLERAPNEIKARHGTVAAQLHHLHHSGRPSEWSVQESRQALENENLAVARSTSAVIQPAVAPGTWSH